MSCGRVYATLLISTDSFQWLYLSYRDMSDADSLNQIAEEKNAQLKIVCIIYFPLSIILIN